MPMAKWYTLIVCAKGLIVGVLVLVAMSGSKPDMAKLEHMVLLIIVKIAEQILKSAIWL